MSDAGRVVSGVQHDQDVGVALLPPAGGDEPFDDLAELDRGHRGDVGAGSRRTASSTAVQDVRPASSAATTEQGQPSTI